MDRRDKKESCGKRNKHVAEKKRKNNLKYIVL
jgi:hypothetical protein